MKTKNVSPTPAFSDETDIIPHYSTNHSTVGTGKQKKNVASETNRITNKLIAKKKETTVPAVKKKSWQESQKDGGLFIAQLLPAGYIVIETGDNSNNADYKILDKNGTLLGYGEGKQDRSAGSGQLVVEETISGYVFSNKSNEIANPYNQDLVDLVNAFTQNSDNSRKRIVDLDAAGSTVVRNWLSWHWNNKEVKVFYLTDNKCSFERLTLFENIFNDIIPVLNVPRPKKSGSNTLPKKDRPGIKKILEKKYGDKIIVRDDQEGMFVTFPDSAVSNVRFEYNESMYFLSNKTSKRKKNEQFEIRKLGTTNNLTIIMSMKMKSNKRKSTSQEENEATMLNVIRNKE
ncbi:MAG: hypothetical protein H9W81_12515 [Enterococcus sp.]|nr:hypothetical protein [Enterococcus sp.]